MDEVSAEEALLYILASKPTIALLTCAICREESEFEFYGPVVETVICTECIQKYGRRSI